MLTAHLLFPSEDVLCWILLPLRYLFRHPVKGYDHLHSL